MRTATLYIAEAGGAPFATVEDALILEGDIVRAHAQRDGVLEQEAVQVVFTAADLGGAALPHLLPEGRLRATLVLDDETIIDGATQRELIACSAAVGGERDWTVRVQDEARRELDERLEALDLSAIKGSANALVLSTLVGETAMNLSWYSVSAMAEASLGYVATVVGTLPVFRGGIRYLDVATAPATFFPPDGVYVATAPDPDDDDTTYPKGTAKAFLDALIEAHGWTLRVAYAPFPSSNLVVEVVDGRWIEAAPVLTLDALAEDDWDVSIQPAEKEDFALAMEVGETNPAYGYLNDLGGYAARVWRRDGEGEPTNTTLVSLEPFALPSYEWDDITTETLAYDADYSETQRRARPVLDVDATDAWHLVVARSGKGIFERRPTSPAPGFAVQLEVWPGSLYPAHALAAYSRVEVRGLFDVETAPLPSVGSSDRVEVDGLTLAVVEASINEDTYSATLTLARPVNEYDAVAAFPPAFAPIGLAGEILPTTPAGGYWMRVTWHPDARTMLPISYEAEVDGTSGWEALAVYGDARVPYAEINGVGETDSQIMRVRSVFVTGVVSDWTVGVLP